MSQKTKAPAQTECRVVISVSGGIADVLFKPMGVEVRILDYDVDGEDAENLDRDPDGRACCIQQHAADEKIVSHEHWPMVRNAVRRINGNGHGHHRQRWQCQECRRIVHCTDDSLAEAGTPFCPDCDQDMQMI